MGERKSDFIDEVLPDDKELFCAWLRRPVRFINSGSIPKYLSDILDEVGTDEVLLRRFVSRLGLQANSTTQGVRTALKSFILDANTRVVDVDLLMATNKKLEKENKILKHRVGLYAIEAEAEADGHPRGLVPLVPEFEPDVKLPDIDSWISRERLDAVVTNPSPGRWFAE